MMTTSENSREWRRLPWRIIGWSGAGLVLLLPVLTNAPWTASDFLLLVLLLGGAGLGLELSARKGSATYRIATALALGTAFLLIVSNGAVGIIGSEQEKANILYMAPIGFALLGAVVARFRPVGMAWAMSAASLVTAMVPVAASSLTPDAPIWQLEPLALTAFFSALWFLSAWLFRRAARC